MHVVGADPFIVTFWKPLPFDKILKVSLSIHDVNGVEFTLSLALLLLRSDLIGSGNNLDHGCHSPSIEIGGKHGTHCGSSNCSARVASIPLVIRLL